MSAEREMPRISLPAVDLQRAPLSVSICGVGGQGVVLAGVILGEAAVRSGLWAAQSAAYTVAARGGFARSEVVIARRPQACPLVELADVIVGLASEGWQGDKQRLRGGGLAICDTGVGTPADVPDASFLTVPMGKIALAADGLRSINLVALGVLVGLLGILEPEAVIDAAEAQLGSRPGNAAAIRAGVDAANELRRRNQPVGG